MIVEFIGCTGAGKSTLISQVQSRLAHAMRVVTAHELVAGRIGLGGVTHPTAQNLLEELAGFPFVLRSLRNHRPYLALTVRLLMRNSRSTFTTLNYLRSLERKIGVYEITRRHHRDAIVLVDEGPIQSVHMFAPDADSLSEPEIARLARLLPLPDFVVYVRSPVDTLVKRTLNRPDPPREVRSKSRTATEAHIRGAVALFDRLVEAGNLRGRVLIVENTGRSQQEYNELVEHVAQSILNCGSARYGAEMSEQLIPELS